MAIIVLAGILVGSAVLLAFVGMSNAWEQSRQNRIEEYVGEQMVRSRSPSAAARRVTGLAESADELVQGFDKILRSVWAFDNLAYALQRAGLRLTVTEYLGIWLLSVAGSAVLGYLLFRNGWLMVIAGAVGGLMPHVFVRLREANRLHTFNSQLGNVLMQLSGSMRAGYGLLQAIDFVSHEMPAPARLEFAQVVRDVKLGSSLMEAMDSMAERVGSEDLMLIVTAVRIHHETGGNLAEILDMVAGTIRERVRIKGELRTLTAQQRYSGYVLAGLPILLFLVLMLLNPEYESRLFTPGLTLCIPFGALLSMGVGFLAIRRIISIEV